MIADNAPLEQYVIKVQSVSPSAPPSVNVDALTAAVNHLVTKLDSVPQQAPSTPWFNWTAPVTHFVDILPVFNTTSLAIVMGSVLITSIAVIIILYQSRKNSHAESMIKSVAVPLDAFTAVVQQSATTTELLSRKLEDLGDGLGHQLQGLSTSISGMSENVARLTQAVAAQQNAQTFSAGQRQNR